MNHHQSHVLETLRQAQVFLEKNAAVVGPTIASSRKSLDDVVTQLSAHATAQESGNITSRGETARQRVLRSSLRRDHMRPIAEVAKQKLRDVPERSEEHTAELQSLTNLVCRLLLEKKHTEI